VPDAGAGDGEEGDDGDEPPPQAISTAKRRATATSLESLIPTRVNVWLLSNV
jgi:hypothetical protein